VAFVRCVDICVCGDSPSLRNLSRPTRNFREPPFPSQPFFFFFFFFSFFFFLPVFFNGFFQFVHSSALRLASDDDDDEDDDEDDDDDEDEDAVPRRRRAGEPALFKKPLPIQSLATPMALSDDLLHDDEDEFDEPPDFTPDSSPARRFRRVLPPVVMPLHQQQLWWHRLNSAGDVSAPTSSPMSVRSSSVNPISQPPPPPPHQPQHSVGSSARACPPTPSPVRVAGEFRRPRANVIVTLTDAAEPSSDLLAAEENAIADRQALEQLTAAGHGHGGASTRLFAATLSDKRPPPSPRYRPPRSPAPVRRRAMSQAQPVLSNPFSPARRRAQTENSSQHSCEQAATSAAATTTTTTVLSGGAAALALGAAPSEPLSRYHSDFTEQGVLGTGVSSVVYKASNNTDGWVYAIKVKQGAAHGIPRQALNEMFALAALGSHVNVIRYYNAWIEEQCLYLQCEFCSGGSVEQRVAAGGVFSEPELCVLFRQMAGALAHIHAHELVHLDVKPENMFIATGGPAPVVDAGASVYKLGDLGLISAVSDVNSFEDGDSRYLPTELLNADATTSSVDLTRADVFSLGASIYELARRRPLPARDAEWHEIRRGNMTRPAHISAPLFELIVATMDARVARRPSAADLLQHRLLLTPSQRQIEELTARVRQLEQQLHHHAE
jgi:wee1-like protein kinase